MEDAWLDKKPEEDILDKLPYAVAMPLRVADRVFDLATDVTATALSVSFTPVKATYRLFSSFLPSRTRELPPPIVTKKRVSFSDRDPIQYPLDVPAVDEEEAVELQYQQFRMISQQFSDGAVTTGYVAQSDSLMDGVRHRQEPTSLSEDQVKESEEMTPTSRIRSLFSYLSGVTESARVSPPQPTVQEPPKASEDSTSVEALEQQQEDISELIDRLYNKSAARERPKSTTMFSRMASYFSPPASKKMEDMSYDNLDASLLLGDVTLL